MTVGFAGQDARSYSRFDGEFHQTLFRLAANPFLIAAGQAFAAKMAAVRNRLGAHPEHMAKSYEQHVELLALIERAEVGSSGRSARAPYSPQGQIVLERAGEAPKSRWERILELSE